MSKQNFWSERIREGAVLNPIDRIGEVLFGLIMVLSFTGAISAATDGREEIGELLWAALGCNVAWGLVDAIMYLMNIALERGRGILIFKKLVNTENSEQSRALLKDEIQPAIAAVITDSELDQINARIKELPEPRKMHVLTSADVWAGFQIFLLVFLCTFPVAFPFIWFGEISLAMRVSNGIALLMLFVGGYMLAGYAGFNRLMTALVYTLIGVLLVALTMALGG